MTLPKEYSQMVKSGKIENWDAYHEMVSTQQNYQDEFLERNNLDGLDYCDDKDYFQNTEWFKFVQCNTVYYGWRDSKYHIAVLGKGLCAFQFRCDLIVADTKEDADRLMLIECKRQIDEYSAWRDKLYNERLYRSDD